MLSITQVIDLKKSYSNNDNNRLNRCLSRLGDIEFDVDTELIGNDIYNLNKRIGSINKRNVAYKVLVNKRDFLVNILNSINNGKIVVSWYCNRMCVHSKDIDISNYGGITNYVVVKDESLVSLDFTRVLDMIAFELAYEDLTYKNWKDIEEELSDIGIASITDSDVLFDRGLVEDGMYKETLKCLMGNSKYADYKSHKVKDYFGNIFKVTAKVSYKLVLQSSKDIVMGLILRDRLEKDIYGMKFVGIDSGVINFIIDNKVLDNYIDKLSESVVIRVFGRMFKVNPIISMF